jgi:hypothetical protein
MVKRWTSVMAIAAVLAAWLGGCAVATPPEIRPGFTYDLPLHDPKRYSSGSYAGAPEPFVAPMSQPVPLSPAAIFAMPRPGGGAFGW